MSKDFTLHRVPFVHLYRDLSFEEFFGRYDPWRDGKVTAATYSFSHKDFGFWAKLLPNSVIYVDQKYEPAALEFLKRYPWFEVRSISRLHSKVILFEKSGVLLVGSENLYAPSSSFSEVMIETVVPEDDRQAVSDLMFGELCGKLLFCKYGASDLRLHRHGNFDEGIPFVPCNAEVDHWNLIANAISFGPNGVQYPAPEFHRPQRLYAVFEYEVSGNKHYLAINRGYGYCGDLDEAAFAWLMENCSIEHVHEHYNGGQFPTYHPVPKDRLPERAIWFGPVKDHEGHEALKLSVVTPQSLSHARLAEAIEIVRKGQDEDGRWSLQHSYKGKTYFELERLGAPSRWNTLRALRVLKWWDGDSRRDQIRSG